MDETINGFIRMGTCDYNRMLKSRTDRHRLKQFPFFCHHLYAYGVRGRDHFNLRLTGRKQQRIYSHFITLVERFEMYGRKIRKRQDYMMDIGTMTADDSRSPEKYITDEYRYVKLYPQLYDGCKKDFSKGMRNGNYLGGLTGRTSTAFNRALKQGATTNRPFDGCMIPAKVNGMPYFLTPEERNAIYEMDLSDDPALASYRDVFMFQCLVGCRYNNLVLLTSGNIVNGAMEYIPHKTGEKNPGTVRVSPNEKAWTVLERPQGRQRTRTLVPHNSGSRYNATIRKLLTLAGITRNVPVLDPKRYKEIMKPINGIAGSRITRRGFTGNLYRQEKAPEPVAPISCHAEGSHVFARYRTTDDGMEMEQVNLINEYNNK